MSGLFSSPPVAKPVAPPPSPVLDQLKQQERQAVADAASADLLSGGRGSTNVGGRKIAMEAQMERGKKRNARAGDELL